MIIKEYGSDFHYNADSEWYLKDASNSLMNNNDFSLFFSGRSALANLLDQGIKESGWKQVFIPSYYCHEVVHFIERLPIKINYYDYNPLLDSPTKQLDIQDVESNVIINVSFFGLKGLDLSFLKVIIVDDLTHDILGYENSNASYCFGSLRKELPVPVGGFCYSPKGYNLPNASHNLAAEEVAIQKLSAMLLKKQYLEGTFADKDLFRSLFIESENAFELKFTNSSIPEVAKSILFQLDINKILEAKKNNVKTALELLKDIADVKFNNGNSDCSFGLLVECNSKQQRDALKLFLISRKIFPAILWPNQLLARDKAIEDQLLFLHMDYRYTINDIEIITKAIKDQFKI